MLDLYIHAATEAAAKAALPALLDAEGNWCLGSHRWCFDPVGAVVDTPASFDAAGNLLAAATFLPGWRGNLRLLDESLLPILEASGLLIAAPATPARFWA